MLTGPADIRSSLEADRSDMGGGRGRPGADRRVLAGMPMPLATLGSSSPVPRYIVDAGSIGIEPCRVTTAVSRMTL